MIPHRAYVDLPTQIVSTSRGILKYSTDRASANEFGGTMQTSDCTVTNDRSSKFFGSTTVQFTFVNTLYSSATRRSYPYEDTPYEITPLLTCFSENGLIMSCSRAVLRIQRSLFIMRLLRFGSFGLANRGCSVILPERG